MINHMWRIQHLNNTIMNDCNSLPNRHCFYLVMRYVDHGLLINFV